MPEVFQIGGTYRHNQIDHNGWRISAMEEIKFSLNGKEITAAVDPKMSLLRYLRDELGMVGA